MPNATTQDQARLHAIITRAQLKCEQRRQSLEMEDGVLYLITLQPNERCRHERRISRAEVPEHLEDVAEFLVAQDEDCQRGERSVVEDVRGFRG